MTDLDLRPVTDEEFPTFARTCERAFGIDVVDEDIEWWAIRPHLDRTLAAFDDGRMVATSGALPLTLSVPGGGEVPMAGITAVGVLPSHRRRGLLSTMMRRLLDTAAEASEPVAGLWASESVIYGRFGFGWAVSNADYELPTRPSAFRTPVDTAGRIRLLDRDEAVEAVPLIYEGVRRATAGMVAHPLRMWEGWLGRDPEHVRDDAGPRQVAVLEDRGYAVYRVKEDWSRSGPDHTALLLQLAATDDEATRLLWRWMLDLDLVTRIKAFDARVESPLPHLLADPRRLRPTTHDSLWVRVLDVPRALAARRYPGDGGVTVEVVDGAGGYAAGRWRLEVAGGEAGCQRTEASPDLTLGAEELGAVYLGGTRLRQLARAGRVDEHTAGAVARADALLAWPEQPWCPIEF